MLDVIRQLLVLQDRDRKIMRLKDELAHVEPEKANLAHKLKSAQAALDSVKLKSKIIETDRKALEVEVDTHKQKIDKYSIQQFETRKNEEFKALGHEIDTCKAAIVKLEDRQLEFMEQADAVQKEILKATEQLNQTKKLMDGQVAQLNDREVNLRKELESLQSNRSELVSGIDEGVRSKYERLLKNKGENVVVGIEHGVCGGCHMRFPIQIIFSCRGEKEIVHCPNCGRILYYTSDMDLAIVD
jgi:predicted  nucleic acid-binding Zn-ribbon protein